ncbi:MAG: hypothetical protein JWM85_2053 [Acidimicrobiaceae bacterium]|nr:hypothetical protein [Acidimicrobiaceae bacterium]
MSEHQESDEELPTTSEPTQNAEKDPADWITGHEPMTGAQASYLATLAHDAGREVPESLTKAEASRMIDELQAESGRLKR